MSDEADLDYGFEESLADEQREAEQRIMREARPENRYENMTGAQIAALADRARMTNADPEVGDEPAAPWAAMDDATILATAEAVKSGVTDEFGADGRPVLNDENDPKGLQRYARRYLDGKAAGLDGEMLNRFADGDITLDDALARREDQLAEERGEVPLNDMEKLSDDQFMELYAAAKTGAAGVSGSGVERTTFAKQASSWLAPPSFDEVE